LMLNSEYRRIDIEPRKVSVLRDAYDGNNHVFNIVRRGQRVVVGMVGARSNSAFRPVFHGEIVQTSDGVRICGSVQVMSSVKAVFVVIQIFGVAFFPLVVLVGIARGSLSLGPAGILALLAFWIVSGCMIVGLVQLVWGFWKSIGASEAAEMEEYVKEHWDEWL